MGDIEQTMLEGGLPPSEWDPVARHLLQRAGGSCATADRLLAAAEAPTSAKLDAYLDVYLTQDLKARANSYLAVSLRNAEPAICARLDRERERLLRLLEERRSVATHVRTMALLTLVAAALDRYALLKRRAGLLDFPDLIARTRLLVTRSASAWVLYKLDAGIDHVLIDEAQDTSPDQWAILRALTDDIFAGAGARPQDRTVFAVGDDKQSIYSFQGARPAMVEAVRQDFMRRASGAGLPFHGVELLLSFRSAPRVLDFVDRIFAHPGNARGLTAARDTPPPHEALKASLPGLVELWPAVKPLAVPEPTDWRLPLDLVEPGAPQVIVARRIADKIAAMIAPQSGETVDAGDGERRPVRPGDIMILVRSRSAFFDTMIRELKLRGVTVAGADRLNLTDHIAALDLIAAGRATLLPDDDLSVACFLKSPLGGLDDDDLLAIAPGRTGSLDAALRASPVHSHRAAAERLAIWRDRAATLTPFAFYTRLLGEDGGRRQLLGRLGGEAADVIDEFVALTLAHERDGAPSLLAFLARLETETLPIKRDLEAASDAVRVMTVHAAKGLESKIVFLPDTCGAPNGRHDAKLFRLDDGDGSPLLAWSPRMDADPPAVAARRAIERDAAGDEHRRLLYVALTRAEERLYIAGFRGKDQPSPDSWYDMILAADLGPSEAVQAAWDTDDKTILRWADPMATPTIGATPFAEQLVALPDWIWRAAAPETPAAPPIRPSNPIGAADHPDRSDGDDGPALGARRAAAVAGRLAHRLLQHLPALPDAMRHEAGRRFLARHGGRLDAAARDGLLASVLDVIAAPSLAPLFGPGSRAEVAIAAMIARPGGGTLAVTGQIDRLAETKDAVLIADFKSGRPRPMADTPPSYLAQLALYAAAVTSLYPDKPVRTVLVWTAGPTVVPIDPATLARALETLPSAAH